MVNVEGEEGGEADSGLDSNDDAPTEPHEAVVQLFETLIPQNIFKALAEDVLLSVMVISIVVGCLLKRDSPILRVVKEIEEMVLKIITFLIKLAPVGVFFLILPNMFRLDISEIGQNLGVLIGAGQYYTFASLMCQNLEIAQELPPVFFGNWLTRNSTGGNVHSPVHYFVNNLCRSGKGEPLYFFPAHLAGLDDCLGLCELGCYATSNYADGACTRCSDDCDQVHSTSWMSCQHGWVRESLVL